MYYVSVFTGLPMATLNMTNSIFIRNSADTGGALNTEDIESTITNCTFSDNTVSDCCMLALTARREGGGGA
jgi:hypothetical protein